MPGNTLASRTRNLNFVNLLASIQLASDWFKNNQLLSKLTHAHYREPVPLKLLFAEPVLLRLPILIVLLSYGILFVHLSPLVVSPVRNLLSSLFIKLCSPLWLTLMRWKLILHVDISDNLSQESINACPCHR